MTLVLSPSFDDHTREQVEAYLDMVRGRRIAGAVEYHQAITQKLHIEGTVVGDRLIRSWTALGKALERLERDMQMVEKHLETCTMLKEEMGLVHDRIDLIKGE
jgi:hypothetical protein